MMPEKMHIVQRKVFEDMKDLIFYLNKYFEEYDPRGYGTKATIYYSYSGEMGFVLELERYRSCD